MFVCILLVTVLTAHSLQVSGMVPSPKGGNLSYKFQEHENFERYKRDTAIAEPERSQFIDTLFNIPIKTLTAVNNLIQSSRPAIKKFREFAAKRFEKPTKAPEPEAPIQKRSPVYIRPVGEIN